MNHSGDINKMVRECVSNEQVTGEATPNEELRRQILSPHIGKNEREWWAAGTIEKLEFDLNAANERIKQLEDARTVAAANSLANMLAYEDAVAKIKKLEQLLNKIEEILKRPAANHRLMQIAGPARQVINIIKQAKEAKP